MLRLPIPTTTISDSQGFGRYVRRRVKDRSTIDEPRILPLLQTFLPFAQPEPLLSCFVLADAASSRARFQQELLFDHCVPVLASPIPGGFIHRLLLQRFLFAISANAARLRPIWGQGFGDHRHLDAHASDAPSLDCVRVHLASNTRLCHQAVEVQP